MPLLSCQPQYCLGYFDTGVSATLDADLIPVHSISHFSPLWVRGTATTQIAAGTGLAATADHDHVMNLEVIDRKSTRLNSSHTDISRMPSSA